MLRDYLFLAMVILMTIGFGVLNIFMSRLLAPLRPSNKKDTTYECGVEPVGQAWVPMRLSFYLYALVFVLFDIETVFLMPVLVIYKHMGWLAFFEVGAFILILIAGLWYAWKKGVLKWQ